MKHGRLRFRIPWTLVLTALLAQVFTATAAAEPKPLLGKIAGVVRDETGPGRVGKGGGRDEIAAPELGRVDAALPGQHVDEALGEIGGRDAAQAVSLLIARGVVQGPTLGHAVAVAAQLRVALPADLLRSFLLHADSPRFNLRSRIVLTFNWFAGDAPQHRDLADVR